MERATEAPLDADSARARLDEKLATLLAAALVATIRSEEAPSARSAADATGGEAERALILAR
jgi:hypothetical protein